MVDLGPLGARELTGRQSLCLHPALRVGAAGAETPVNLALSSLNISARPPHGQSVIRVLIREQFAAGRLPHDHLPLIRSGPANGGPCDGREEPVTRTQTLMETLDPRGRKVIYHAACFHVWNVERQGADNE